MSGWVADLEVTLGGFREKEAQHDDLTRIFFTKSLTKLLLVDHIRVHPTKSLPWIFWDLGSRVV